MANTTVWNGVTYSIPEIGEFNWGDSGVSKVDGLLLSLSNNGFQKTGGSFILSADVDFGAVGALKVGSIKNRSGVVSTTGTIRLANVDAGIGWRNAANSGDLLLTVDATDKLIFGGSSVYITTTAGIFLGANGTVSAPTFSWASESSTGFYRAAANDIRLTIGSGDRNIFLQSQTQFPVGTVAAPGISFMGGAGFSDCGMYTASGNTLGFAVGGLLGFKVEQAAAYFKDGTSSLPGITFISDVDSGFYRIGANSIGLSLAGANVVSWSVTETIAAGDLKTEGNLILNGTGTGATYTSITAAQTTSRTHTIPDVANDTFVMLGATQTLIGKTISAATNTITLLSATIPNNAANTSGTASNITGILALVNGGTGVAAASANAAFNALSPLTTSGDTLYGGASGAGTRLAKGTDGQVYTLAAGIPSWATPTTGTVTSVAISVPTFLSVSGSPITGSGTLAVTLSGTALPIANGGTGQTAKTAAFDALSPLTTQGDIIYFDGTNNVRLAKGTTSQVLTMTATIPSWAAAAGGGVTGPGSSTDKAIAIWNGTGGTTLADSTVTIPSSGKLNVGTVPTVAGGSPPVGSVTAVSGITSILPAFLAVDNTAPATIAAIGMNGGVFAGFGAGTSLAAPAAVNTNTLLKVESYGYNGTNYVLSGQIRFVGDTGGWTSGSNPTKFILALTSSGNSSPNDLLTVNGAGTVTLTNGCTAPNIVWTTNGGGNIGTSISAGSPNNIYSKLIIQSGGSMVVGGAALATGATDGFLYLPSSAGLPTGTPTVYTGGIAADYDSTNDVLYAFNASWKKVGGKQTAFSTAVTTNGSVTSTTFADFTNNVSLTFTPSRTGKFEIFCQTTVYTDVTGANGNAVVTINASAGTPSVVGDAYFTPSTSAVYMPVRVFLITTLTKGTAYTFKLQGKNSSGQVNLDNSHTTNGTYLVAVEID